MNNPIVPRYISAGIDIGSDTTRVVIVEKTPKEGRLKVIGTGKARSQGIRQGYVVNAPLAVKSIAAAVREAEKAAGTRIKKSLAAVGGISLESFTASGTLNISRVDGEITEADVAKVIEISEDGLDLVNKKVIHRIPLRFKVDGKEVLGRPQGMRGIKLEAKMHLIACLDQHLEDLLSAIEETGVEVEDVVASPFAAGVASLSKAQRTAGCVLANVGAETVSIAVFENDNPISLQVFPLGSSNLTNDIALGFRIPLEEAEEIKVEGLGQKDLPQKKLDEIMEARLKDIFDLIEAHLKKLGLSGLLPAGIVLTGGGVGVTTIEDLAKASLNLPARVVIPHALGHDEGTSIDTSWSVAYGLCILGFNGRYQSDIPQTMRTPIRNGIRSFISWLKQFSP